MLNIILDTTQLSSNVVPKTLLEIFIKSNRMKEGKVNIKFGDTKNVSFEEGMKLSMARIDLTMRTQEENDKIKQDSSNTSLHNNRTGWLEHSDDNLKRLRKIWEQQRDDQFDHHKLIYGTWPTGPSDAFKALLEYEINCIKKYDRPFGLPSLPIPRGEQMVDFAAKHNTTIQEMKNQRLAVERELKRLDYE